MSAVTSGAQIVPATLLDSRNILHRLSPVEIGELDPGLGDWARRTLGRDALATAVLPALGTVYAGLLNIDAAGIIVLSRTHHAARVHLLAVVPDMRRKGLARTMLTLAMREAKARDLRWLWMNVPSENQPALHIALSCGFKRYIPQFLRRKDQNWLALNHGEIYTEPAQLDDLNTWTLAEVESGDTWAADLVRNELRAEVSAGSGKSFRLMWRDHAIGLARVAESDLHAALTLWLERVAWGTPAELHCLKAALNTLGEPPPSIDIHYGSDAHLRCAYPLLKPLGFKPQLKPRMLMLHDLNADKN